MDAIVSNRLPILAAEINAEHLAAHEAAESALEHAAQCGRLLLEAKELLPHDEWLPWLEANTKVVARQSQKYMRLAQNWEAVEEKRTDGSHLSINDALGLIADGIRISPVLHLTGDTQWFTPEEVLAAVRVTFGGTIDLDPASCATAQQRVQARVFYDKDSNGLDYEWGGKVFLNPPYDTPTIRAFVDKLIFEFESGRVKSAILLTNDQTDAGWFQKAAGAARIFCFPYKRLNFYNPNRDGSNHTCNSTIFYFGADEQAFQSAFSSLGYFCRIAL
jgi:hypothetical protein